MDNINNSESSDVIELCGFGVTSFIKTTSDRTDAEDAWPASSYSSSAKLKHIQSRRRFRKTGWMMTSTRRYASDDAIELTGNSTIPKSKAAQRSHQHATSSSVKLSATSETAIEKGIHQNCAEETSPMPSMILKQGGKPCLIAQMSRSKQVNYMIGSKCMMY